MRLCAYLSQSRHGIFYFRYPIERGSRKTIRLSLRTRCPNEAKGKAVQLTSYCIALKNSGIIEAMDVAEIKELITDYAQEMWIERVQDEERLGFPAGHRKAYADETRKLAKPIESKQIGIASEQYDGLFQNFRRQFKISESDWLEHSDFIKAELLEARKLTVERLVERFDASVNAIPPQASPMASSEPEKPKHSLGYVIEKYISQRQQIAKVSEKHIKEQSEKLSLLTEYFGDEYALDEIDRAKAFEIESLLLKLPLKRNKLKETRNLPLLEQAEMKGLAKLNPRTVNEYLRTFKQFYDWAIDRGFAENNPFRNAKVEQPDQAKKYPFTDADLKLIYDEFTGAYQPERESYKWAVLVGMFTGARIAEVCQLEIDDIIQKEDIWCFDFNDEPKHKRNQKSLKNKYSARVAPIHNQLLELGFLDYVNRMKTEHGDNARLFPDFTFVKGHGYTKNFARWFNQTYLAEFANRSKRQDYKYNFHCFRHTMNTRLLQAGISENLSGRITGHAPHGVQVRSYLAEGFKVSQLQEALHNFSVE